MKSRCEERVSISIWMKELPGLATDHNGLVFFLDAHIVVGSVGDGEYVRREGVGSQKSCALVNDNGKITLVVVL
jgi:hypothetical protein